MRSPLMFFEIFSIGAAQAGNIFVVGYFPEAYAIFTLE